MLHRDSLISFTLDKMKAKINTAPQAEPGNGLLFTGNIHDAIPRRLLLDNRLSPLDKMAWMMIRLYARNNQGAVFPTYDELQIQLASPHKGKASRETVSRVLLMLRLTGWLSLCKKVRDDNGRIQGNIYAQHDEPLSFVDAQALEPGWLDNVASACQHPNKTIARTAWQTLQEIKDDNSMRHFHSHLALLERRLASPQTPQQKLKNKSEPGQKASELSQNKTELRQFKEHTSPDSVSELSQKASDSNRVRKPNHYVRNNIINNKNTYVDNTTLLPEKLMKLLTPDDRTMIQSQLQALPESARQTILQNLESSLRANKISNPAGWLFSVMKRAREGRLYPAPVSDKGAVTVSARAAQAREISSEPHSAGESRRASSAHVKQTLAQIRLTLRRGRSVK